MLQRGHRKECEEKWRPRASGALPSAVDRCTCYKGLPFPHKSTDSSGVLPNQWAGLVGYQDHKTDFSRNRLSPCSHPLTCRGVVCPVYGRGAGRCNATIAEHTDLRCCPHHLLMRAFFIYAIVMSSALSPWPPLYTHRPPLPDRYVMPSGTRPCSPCARWRRICPTR